MPAPPPPPPRGHRTQQRRYYHIYMNTLLLEYFAVALYIYSLRKGCLNYYTQVAPRLAPATNIYNGGRGATSHQSQLVLERRMRFLVNHFHSLALFFFFLSLFACFAFFSIHLHYFFSLTIFFPFLSVISFFFFFFVMVFVLCVSSCTLLFFYIIFGGTVLLLIYPSNSSVTCTSNIIFVYYSKFDI